MEGRIDLRTAERNGYQQLQAGRSGRPGDEGGHLIASIFNGPGERLNLVPMDGNFNKGAWKQLENRIAEAVREGKQVDVKIEVKYGADAARPDSFAVRYQVDGGREVFKFFANAPGGR